jgi:hypothetical protein
MHVIYTYRLFDTLFSRPRIKTRYYSSSAMASYLEHRVLHEHCGGNPLLNSMRQLATVIHNEQRMRGLEATSFEICCQKLCSISMISSGGSMGRFEEIFERQSEVSEEEYEDHVFAAALCTNTLSIVRSCVAKNTELLRQLERYSSSSLFAPFVDLAAWFGDEDLLEFLMTSGTIDLNRRVRALLFASAARAGKMDLVWFLYNFKKEEAPWEFGERSSEHKHEIEALYRAMDTTNLETLKFVESLREQYPPWPNSFINMESKLADCAAYGLCDTVSYLLDRGVDARGGPSMHPPWVTNAPVLRACQSSRGTIDVIELLLEHGADPNVTIATAASKGQTTLVRQLLNRGIAPVRALSAAAAGPYFDTVRVLIDAGVDVNEDIGSRSPLASAIGLEHTELFKFLIDHGADITSPGTAEECVKRARKDGLDSMLCLLKECGVNVGDGYGEVVQI